MAAVALRSAAQAGQALTQRATLVGPPLLGRRQCSRCWALQACCRSVGSASRGIGAALDGFCSPSTSSRSPPRRPQQTTYEGGADEGEPNHYGVPLGFSRSCFVQELRCSSFDISEKYVIGDKLGTGATATVYKSVNRRTGEEVAVKIMSKADVKDDQLLQNEIKIHKATDHPNVLRLLEVYEDDCNLYLVTELCRGGDLWKHLTKNSDEFSACVIAEESALQLIVQIVNAVMYLHARGIVHRDLKPSNFLCSLTSSRSEPTILKLADFGVSAFCREKHRLTRKVGTDGFIAPEILRNQPYNEKADIFSIGCILHMMLTGHPPKFKECGDYSISKIRLKFVSKEFRELVETMMLPQPDERPSAQEIFMSPLLMRVREQSWVHSARLDAQLLDNMYAFGSFPLLKKAALVAMVSRAESDDCFQNCIKKFMSLESSTSGITAEDVYQALSVEMVDDMDAEARRSLQLPGFTGSPAGPSVARRRRSRRPASGDVTADLSAAEGRELFKKELRHVAEELVNRIDVSNDKEISYSEWLAATVDAAWFTDTQRIQATFKLFDCDGDGVISIDDLQKVIPNVFKKVDVKDVLLESQHRLASSINRMREKDFALLLQTHKPSQFTLKRIRDGLEDAMLPA